MDFIALRFTVFGMSSCQPITIFAALSGSVFCEGELCEPELRTVNFGGSGGNNGTIRKSLIRALQRWSIHNFVKFEALP